MRSLTLSLALGSCLAVSLNAAAQSSQEAGAAPALDCGYLSPTAVLDAVRGGAQRGEYADPALRQIPSIQAGAAAASGSIPCLTNADVFAFEDTNGLLLTNFSTGALLNLMTQAANALMATHGDNYDFVGYWVNFTPHHLIGAAFYAGIRNDVTGIGQAPFDSAAALGLGGNNIEGYVMMWDINNNLWQPGVGANADFTRLALGQEFEHRFGMFLPPLLDGRVLQGDNASCGRQAHWSWRVDGQGSSMEISEWIGASPAQLQGSFVTFNTDIPGSVFSYSDLYLMGYVSPAEMDAGNSELRFMNNSTCGPTHGGVITSFDSSDIIAAAGPRVPDSTTAQLHFRTGWIMIHQPGDVPDAGELGKAVAIMQQHQLDWSHSTLGRGTMDNSLFTDCNCNGVPDAMDISAGTSQDVNGNGVPDECECGGMTYCTAKTTSSGCVPTLTPAGVASASAGSGFTLTASQVEPSNNGLFFYGQNGPAAIPALGGFLCVNPPILRTPVTNSGGIAICTGNLTVDFNAYIASGSDPALVAGSVVHGQWWFRDPPDPTSGSGLTEGVTFVICP